MRLAACCPACPSASTTCPVSSASTRDADAAAAKVPVRPGPWETDLCMRDGTHTAPDPRGRFDARYDGGDEVSPGKHRAMLGEGQGARERDGAIVPTRPHVVELEPVDRGSVHHRRRGRGKPQRRTSDRGVARRLRLLHRRAQGCRPRQTRAQHTRTDRVEDHQFDPLDHVIWDVLEGRAGDLLRERTRLMMRHDSLAFVRRSLGRRRAINPSRFDARSRAPTEAITASTTSCSSMTPRV